MYMDYPYPHAGGPHQAADCLKFEYDASGALSSVAVRFYRPKERHCLPVNSQGFTRWVTIPAIADQLVCFATLVADYISRTESFPIHGDAFILSEHPDRIHEYALVGSVFRATREVYARRYVRRGHAYLRTSWHIWQAMRVLLPQEWRCHRNCSGLSNCALVR